MFLTISLEKKEITHKKKSLLILFTTNKYKHNFIFGAGDWTQVLHGAVFLTPQTTCLMACLKEIKLLTAETCKTIDY